jgi:hypothetical protein
MHASDTMGQVFHITKPSRVLLEITRDAWVEELGYTPTVSQLVYDQVADSIII